MNRRVLLVAFAAAAALAGIWYVALWSPSRNDLHAAHTRAAAAQQQADDLGIKVRALTAARKDMPAKQVQLDQLRAAVPDSPQLDQIIGTVNDAAKGSGITLSSLAPQPPATGPAGAAPVKPAGAPNDLNVTMQVTGTYFQVMDFMNRLNSAPRLVLLDSVNVAGSADKSGKVTTSLNAKLFVQPPTAAASTPNPSPTPTGGK